MNRGGKNGEIRHEIHLSYQSIGTHEKTSCEEGERGEYYVNTQVSTFFPKLATHLYIHDVCAPNPPAPYAMLSITSPKK